MASGLHEEFSREHAVEAASNKRFGVVVGGIALAFGALRTWWHYEVGWLSGVLIAIGFVLIAAALIKPDALAGAHRGWMKLGLLLHKVTNPIFLGGDVCDRDRADRPDDAPVRCRPDGTAASEGRDLLDCARQGELERGVSGKAVLRG